MKFKRKKVLLMVALFTTPLLMATDSNSETVKSEVKELKVEEGASRIGEETQEKTRALTLNFEKSEVLDANMNIGKLEFVVK